AAGQDAARACAVNVLAQLQAAAGCLDAVTRLVKLTVYVACTGEFVQHPQVADGASQLLLDVLGAAAPHARSAIGVAALPLQVRVEPLTGSVREDAGPGFVLKLEQLQCAGSFKTRGAFANLLLREIPPAGVIAASGGNHGVAV